MGLGEEEAVRRWWVTRLTLGGLGVILMCLQVNPGGTRMGSVMGRGGPLQRDTGHLSWRQPRGPGSWQALPLWNRSGRASWTAPPLRISPYLLRAFCPSRAGAAPLLLLVLGVFLILFHHGLSRDMEWSSLRSTVGPWYLSSL